MCTYERCVLKRLERKFKGNSRFAGDYIQLMQKIIGKGYAEVVPDSKVDRQDGKIWYIPHHGVYHPKKTNKIRVVFDCAASYYGVSLNSVLLRGPNMTYSLINVLMKFRDDDIAVMGDIESMFHHVKVPKEDCDFLRFFWWPAGDVNHKPLIYLQNGSVMLEI